MIDPKELRALLAIRDGIRPDLDLAVDEWADKFMVIPKSTGSNEYGRYKTSRTPHAKEIMRALSDRHPCKRVVCKVASQMFKTQIALNWFASTVHQSPSNFLWLMPTGKLHKRIVARIDKTIAAVEVVRTRVAKPKSRGALNNMDTKEYVGGALFIATAGSAANLSEVPARRVAFDEVDRAEVDVDGEGDPVALAEKRQTTFAHNRKSYYYSSPTIEGESKIDSLFEMGTQREALAECIHCGHAQKLQFDRLVLSDDGKTAMYPCEECGGIHVESDKQRMFANGLWSDPVGGDGETESFTANALFLPYGWSSWRDLMREHESASELFDKGLEERIIVFYNTRLARSWKRTTDVASYQALRDRAENYKLRTAPESVLFLTAGVDTQDNRLAVQIVGWGTHLKAWVIDYVELPGDPANDEVWDVLTKLLNTPIQHVSGHNLPVVATAIDIGGHRGEAVKNYVRSRKINCPIAIFGATRINAQPMSKGSLQDVNWKGRLDKKGVMIHSVGTIEIKHVLYSRLSNDAAKDPCDRMLHFSDQLTDDYFAGIVSESYNRQKRRYEKKPGVRNEPLDTLVYAYAALHHSSIRAHRYSEKDWESIGYRLNNPVRKNIAVQQPNIRPREDIERARSGSFKNRFNGRFSDRSRFRGRDR